MRLIAVSVMLLAAAYPVWAQSAKPRAADPLAAVRARLRHQAVRSHTYVVAHPTPARLFLNPAQDRPGFVSAPVTYTPNSLRH